VGVNGKQDVPDRGLSLTDILGERLIAASRDLLFSTESDRPFEFVRLGAADRIGAVTPERIAALIGQPGARAKEWPFVRFLARHIERVDPADTRARAAIPRYENLESALVDALGEVRVFRVGEIEVQVLAIGNDPATGELAGLATVAVET
jgi:hypothetical protein